MSSGMEKPRILLVNACVDLAQSVSQLSGALGATLIQAHSASDALLQARKVRFAATLLKVSRPCQTPFTLTRMIRSHRKQGATPVIMLAPAHLEDLCTARGYASGITDFLCTPVNRAILYRKMEVFVQLEAQRLELEKHKMYLSVLAGLDPLTQLANRRALASFLEQALADCSSQEAGRGHAAVLLLDIDAFKHINDTLGHGAGDRLLCAVAHRLRAPFRTRSLAARLGGDEFVIAFAHLAHPACALLMAQKIHYQIGLPYRLEGQTVQIAASIGVATSLEAGPTQDRLLSAADAAMYTAKRTGSGIWTAGYPAQEASGNTWNESTSAAPPTQKPTKFQQTV